MRGLSSEVRGQAHRHVKLYLSHWILDSCLKNLRNGIQESQRVSFRKGDFIIGASEEEWGPSLCSKRGLGVGYYRSVRLGTSERAFDRDWGEIREQELVSWLARCPGASSVPSL